MDTSETCLLRGNQFFIEENYRSALEEYTLSIQLDSKNLTAFVNRSATHFHLKNFKESLQDAEEVLKMKPDHSFALYRKAMAAFSLKDFQTSHSAFQKIQQLDHLNVKLWLRKCKAELEEGVISIPTKKEETKKEETKKEEIKKEEIKKEEIKKEETKKEEIKKEEIKKEETKKEETKTIGEGKNVPAIADKRPRFDWYQTPSHVMINLFVKNAKKEQTQIQIEEKHLEVSIQMGKDSEFLFDIELAGAILPQESSFEFLSTKIEIKLKKQNSLQWKTLEIPMTSPINQEVKKTKKNWDQIIKEAGPLDTEGDELNKVFRDIYSGASEEQQRAMIKSFTESGGTVLSTNWAEVGAKKVDISPPSGMEVHHWDE